MPMRQLIVIGTVLLAAACGGPQSPRPRLPGTPAAEPSQAVQLGGPPTGAGTVTADSGEITAGRSGEVPQGAWLLAVRRPALSRAPVLRRRARPHLVVG